MLNEVLFSGLHLYTGEFHGTNHSVVVLEEEEEEEVEEEIEMISIEDSEEESTHNTSIDRNSTDNSYSDLTISSDGKMTQTFAF